MLRRLFLALLLLVSVTPAFAQQIDGAVGSALTVKENDGTPTVSNVNTISLTNATLTDAGGGAVSISIAGTGAPTDGTYITQTPEHNPVAERCLRITCSKN